MTLKQEATLPTSQDHIDANTPMGANLVAGGATFRAWAPRAKARHVLADFNGWTLSEASQLVRDAQGDWAGFVPGLHGRPSGTRSCGGRGLKPTRR